ncbi:ABC transporter permease [Fervidobacterium thailandense]|uniref:ABC transporter permease n=1 Tax=Fervidobacterium thailandense TaxID=1008305 RepID=A0A1E3G459_9BACT|nr:iron ABC transporter permease [Fervidobacterium thailandense]ODN31071.1 ABC transporter permease [Fervidobacterium thailandense]
MERTHRTVAKRLWTSKLASIVPLVYLFAALLVPFAVNLHFVGGVNWRAIVENSGKIRFTIWQAFLSSVLTMLIGLPGAYLVGRTRMHPLVKKIFRIMASVPFVLPGITMAIGFFLAFGRNGLYTRFLQLFGFSPRILYTFGAVLLGHVFYNFPLFIRIVGEAWEALDGHIIESAKLDGASNWDIFRFVELPILLPSILRAFFLTYVYTFTSFSVVLILGGIKYSTIEVAIYMYSRILFDFKSAAALMIFQLIFIATLGYLTSTKLGTEEKHYHVHLEKFPKWGIGFLVLASVLIFVPLVYSGLSGFVDFFGKFSLENFKLLFSGDLEYLIGASLSQIVFYTLLIAVSSTLLAIAIGTIAGYFSSRGMKVQYIVLLPTALSSVTIAFSYVLLKFPPVLKIIVVHSLINLPIVFGILDAGWRKVSQSLLEAARIDGARTFRLLSKVVFPLMWRAVMTAFVYAFTISVGETSATLTLAEPPIMTFAVAVFRLMSSRNVEIAMALNTLYFAFVLVLFTLVELSRTGE